VAPGNTLESFEAALEHGVDMIEFDVLRLRDGRLVLAHDYGDAAKRTPLTLEEGLDLFAGEAYAGVELDVDLKLPGYEEALAIVREIRPLMQRSAAGAPRHSPTWVFERAGRPCRRCGTLIRARGQGDDNRTTYWCRSCQS